MQKRLPYWCVGLLCAFIVSAHIFSSTAHAESKTTLEEALVDAYETNPDLAAGQNRLRASDEQVPQAISAGRPTLFLDGDVTKTDSENDLRASNNESAGVSLSLNQSIYAGGGIEADIRRADNFVRAERARLITLEQNVLLDSVDAYTSVWQDREVLALAENNERRLARQLEATQDFFNVGETTRTDVKQAEARLEGAKADVQQAVANLAASEAFYRSVIGEEAADMLGRPEQTDGLPVTLDEALQIADTNPNIVAANYDVRAARESVDVVFADLLPSLDLNGSVGYTESPSETLDWQRDASIGLNLSVPLYQGGAAYSRVRQSQQTLRAQQDDERSAIREVQRVVLSSWRRLLAADAAIVALMAQVDANEIALDGVQQQQREGLRTVLDVLDAEQELFESQVDLVRAHRSAVLASYEVRSSVGALTVVDLGLNTSVFDPQAYYNRQRTRLFGVSVDE